MKGTIRYENMFIEDTASLMSVSYMGKPFLSLSGNAFIVNTNNLGGVLLFQYHLDSNPALFDRFRRLANQFQWNGGHVLPEHVSLYHALIDPVLGQGRNII